MKNIIMSIFLIIITLTLTGCTIFNDDSPYPKGGRDTVAEFGDRRFVILKGYKPSKEGNIKYFLLYDRKTVESIEDNIYNYKTNKPYVYTVGYNGYTKLNYSTGEYEQNHDLSIFNQEDKDIFIKIENGNSLS